jgi:hypothetical protein
VTAPTAEERIRKRAEEEPQLAAPVAVPLLRPGTPLPFEWAPAEGGAWRKEAAVLAPPCGDPASAAMPLTILNGAFAAGADHELKGDALRRSDAALAAGTTPASSPGIATETAPVGARPELRAMAPGTSSAADSRMTAAAEVAFAARLQAEPGENERLETGAGAQERGTPEPAGAREENSPRRQEVVPAPRHESVGQDVVPARRTEAFSNGAGEGRADRDTPAPARHRSGHTRPEQADAGRDEASPPANATAEAPMEHAAAARPADNAAALPVSAMQPPAAGADRGRSAPPNQAAPRTEAVAAPEQPRPAEALREIRLEVAAGREQNVQLRFVERGGEVTLAVRAADPVLRESLRQALPELGERLERGGYHTETWQPAPSGSSLGDAAGHERGAPDTGQHGGHPHPHQGQGGSREREGEPRPQWVEELDSAEEKA